MAPSEAGPLYAEAAACLCVGFSWGIYGLELGGGVGRNAGGGRAVVRTHFLVCVLKKGEALVFLTPLISGRFLHFPAKWELCWCQCQSDGDKG